MNFGLCSISSFSILCLVTKKNTFRECLKSITPNTQAQPIKHRSQVTKDLGAAIDGDYTCYLTKDQSKPKEIITKDHNGPGLVRWFKKREG